MFAPPATALPSLLDAPPPRPAPGWRALVLSDTHGRLPAAVAGWMADVDLVLHAGDVDDLATWEEVSALAPRLVAVRGNCDQSPLWERLREEEVVETPAGRIALCHGHLVEAPPSRRHEGLLAAFARVPDLAVIVYGHSHRPAVERPAPHGPLVLNPGSASQPRGLPSGSVAFLDVADVAGGAGGARWTWSFVNVPSRGSARR